jgi:hypothetical protein
MASFCGKFSDLGSGCLNQLLSAQSNINAQLSLPEAASASLFDAIHCSAQLSLSIP